MAFAIIALGLSGTPAARAQQQAQGFALERFTPAAPGAGWFVMDDLTLHGGLGGAISLSLGYSHNPLSLTLPGGAQSLAVVQHETSASIAMAVTYDRFRLHAIFTSPVYVAGQGGAVGDWQFTSPKANLEQTPDTISDVQLGLDARLYGEPDGPVRLGGGAQLIVPSGARADYLTDGTYRAAGRFLFAGDLGQFSYAGHAGVHLRPLDDSPVPGSPRGSELLFGLAGGAKLTLLGGSFLLGPELFGATALRSFFGGETTALEALLAARFEQATSAAGAVRIKLGFGAGLHPRFGAPEWRAIVAIELVGQLQASRDGGTAANR